MTLSAEIAARPTVAVLGAGIMGSSVALQLARRNVRVVLFDQSPEPFCGASRWNEGKIQLGYLYGADPSLKTARKLIPGGLAFRRLVQEMLGCPIPTDSVTSHDDTYLVHRDSVASFDQVFSLAQRVAELGRQHPDAGGYFASLEDHRPRRLSAEELARISGSPEVVGGFTAPERSVATPVIADLYVQALAANARIEQLTGRRVISVQPGNRTGTTWRVRTRVEGQDVESGPFNAVVNALWEGRGAIDAALGLSRAETWTNRYRLSLFATVSKPLDLRSAVICVGPFGDVKNYDGRRFYLSWYEAGLQVASQALDPPSAPVLDVTARDEVASRTLAALGRILPGVRGLAENLESVEVQGGWVHSAGTGSLRDATSALHRRDNIGLSGKDHYFSIDTGKYSIAPWLAVQVADAVCEAIGTFSRAERSGRTVADRDP